MHFESRDDIVDIQAARMSAARLTAHAKLEQRRSPLFSVESRGCMLCGKWKFWRESMYFGLRTS